MQYHFSFASFGVGQVFSAPSPCSGSAGSGRALPWPAAVLSPHCHPFKAVIVLEGLLQGHEAALQSLTQAYETHKPLFATCVQVFSSRSYFLFSAH